MRLLALMLALAAGDETELAGERAALEARLNAEKEAFDALNSERKDLLSLLDTLERLSRDSSTRAANLERSAAKTSRAIASAKQAALATQAALVEQQRVLAPRIRSLYRLGRRDAVASLLAASDFASAVRQRRALDAVVREDLRQLDAVLALERYARRQVRRLEALESSNRRTLSALRAEQAIGQARLTRFKDLLASVTAEQNRMSRVIAELEQSEKELTTMVKELESEARASGFRARRGQLPFPARGLVEVGFGKVVNPRFNTVTVQKGLDIRASEGAEVRSVAAGTVAYAGWLKGYGNLVIIDHGGNYHSLYAHLANTQVDSGAALEEGQVVGQVGDTGSLKGSYLYFEIRKDGQAVDPLPWLTPEE